jgi:hypothetical protein
MRTMIAIAGWMYVLQQIRGYEPEFEVPMSMGLFVLLLIVNAVVEDFKASWK